SHFSITANEKNMPAVRFYNQPDAIQYSETVLSGYVRKSWVTNGLKAYPTQPFEAYTYFRHPRLSVVPKTFDLMGHVGNLSSWADFGQFYYELNKDRDSLPENIVEQVRTLIAEDTTVFQ